MPTISIDGRSVLDSSAFRACVNRSRVGRESIAGSASMSWLIRRTAIDAPRSGAAENWYATLTGWSCTAATMLGCTPTSGAASCRAVRKRFAKSSSRACRPWAPSASAPR